MLHTIFISFSSENQLQAERVCNYLEQNGVKCWISSRDCRDSHMTAIPDAIEACKYLVLIASPQSAESPWVPDEINLAKTKKKILVPFDIVKFEYPKEWWMLGTSQRINAYLDFDNALMQLLERVGGQVKASNQGIPKNSEIKSFSSCQDNVTEVKKSNKIDASKVEEVTGDGIMDIIRSVSPLKNNVSPLWMCSYAYLDYIQLVNVIIEKYNFDIENFISESSLTSSSMSIASLIDNIYYAIKKQTISYSKVKESQIKEIAEKEFEMAKKFEYKTYEKRKAIKSYYIAAALGNGYAQSAIYRLRVRKNEIIECFIPPMV